MNRVKMRMAVWGGVCVAVLLACHSEKSRLEEALEAAGGNRSELEQVLEHYRGDSLKSLAAQFLIENMPCHYAYAGKELEKYRRYFERFPPCAWRGPTFVRDSLVEADGAFCPDSLHKVYDVQVIKSDYLIRNIDQAFEVWRGQPWGRNVAFADFLEFILPYRVGTETLADWRQEVYDRYNPMLDSIRASADSTDVLAVVQTLMDSLSVGAVYFTGLFPSGITVGPDLVEWRSGNCRELTDLVTYVFRALGIPGGCDMMLMRGDKNVAHYWNFVVDGEGSTYFASIGQSSKQFAKAETYWDPKGKVYRETFSLNRTMRDACGRDTTDVPPVFREPLMQDVTAAYAGRINRFLRIPADSLALVPREGETVYLCLPLVGRGCPWDMAVLREIQCVSTMCRAMWCSALWFAAGGIWCRSACRSFWRSILGRCASSVPERNGKKPCCCKSSRRISKPTWWAACSRRRTIRISAVLTPCLPLRSVRPV